MASPFIVKGVGGDTLTIINIIMMEVIMLCFKKEIENKTIPVNYRYGYNTPFEVQMLLCNLEKHYKNLRKIAMYISSYMA